MRLGKRNAAQRRRRRSTDRLRERLGNDRGFGLVEVMVATTVGAIGLLAVGGLQLAAATQGRIASWRTGQALAAQQVFEEINRRGYAAAASGSFAATVDGNTYRVNITVSTPTVRVKQLAATVAPVGSVSARTFTTRIYDRRPVPVVP